MIKTAIAITAAILVSTVFGYASYETATATRQSFDQFHTAICQLTAKQAKTSKSFYSLLRTLEERALTREGVDKANHDFNAAAADSDSARLYEAVLASAQGGDSSAAANLCK